MPIGTGIVYNVGDLILSQVSSSGTAFLETKIAAATSSLIYFDSTARINSASLNSITVGTASYVSGSTSIITNLTASNISASGTSSFGYVGIGTTSPTSKLDVTGGNIELDPNQFITFNNAGTVPKIGYRTSGTQAGLDLFDNSGLVTISIGNQGVGIGDYAGGNALPNKGLAVSGNVGIGTTIPNNKLDIWGGTGTTFNMANDSDSGRGGKLTFISSSATGRQFYVGTNSSIYNLVFGIDSIEKMRLDTSGYFAINTTNTTPYSSLFPGQLVVDAGTSNVDGIFSSTNNTNAAELILTKKNPTNNFGSLLIQHSGSSGDAIALNYNVNTSTGVGGTNSFKVTTDGTGYFRGNVGIGSSSPAAKLDVFGSTLVTTTKSTYALAVGNANTDLTIGTDSTNAYIQSWSSKNLYLNNQGNNILCGGSVGIGTTSPGALLDVSYGDYQSAGTVRIGADLGANTSRTNNTRKYGAITLFPYNNASASVQAIGIDAQGPAVTGLTIGGGGTGFASPTQIQFYTTSSTIVPGAERMRIDSSGNVGIGTSSPAQKLEVQSGSVLIRGDGTALFGTYYASAGENTFFTLHSGSGNTFHIGNDVSGTNYNTMVFTAATDTTGGKVGIGTSSPGSKLQINDNTPVLTIRANDGGVSRKAYIDFYTTFFNFPSDVGARRTSTIVTGFDSGVWGTEFLSFNVGSGSTNDAALLPIERVRIDGSGNLGVGTTNPVAKLQVAGNVSGSSFTSSISNAVGFLGTSSWAQNVVSASYATTAQTANALNPANSYTITNLTASNISASLTGSFGYVGIGTTSPVSKLHVVGEGDTVTLQKSNNVPALAFLGTSTNKSVIEGGDNLNFFTSGSSRFYIKNDGNVGIGTSSPNSKLEVYSTSWEPAIRLTSTSGSVKTYGLVVNPYWATGSFHIYDYTLDYSRLQVASNGNVGIGVGASNPGYTLEVNGTQRVVGNFYLFNTVVNPASNYANQRGVGFESSTGKLEVAASASNALSIGRFGSTGQILDFRYAGTQIGNFSLDTNDLTLATARHLILSPTGNVGIGTTSPATKFHVYGTGAGFEFGVNSPNCYIETIDRASVGKDLNTGYYTRGTGSFTWNNAAYTERMRIDGSGNVGIGTTVPVAKLQVNGNISGSSFTSSISNAVGFLGTSSWAQNVVSASFATTAQTANALNTSNNYQVNSIGVGMAGSGTAGRIGLNEVGIRSWSITPTGGRLVIEAGDGLGSVIFSCPVTSSNFVGPGTGLTGTAASLTAGTANALNASNTYTVAGLTSAYVDVTGAGTIPTTGIYRPSTKTLGLSADSTLIFKISNASAPATSSIETGNFIVQTGNVGIGQSSPASKLHVLGSSYISASANTSNVKFEGDGGNGLAFGTIDATSTYASWIQSGYVPNFGTATYNLLLQPLGGNVGIGTSSPSGKLDIAVSSTMGTYGPGTINLKLRNTNTSETNSGAVEFIGYSGNAVSPYQWATISAEKQTSAGNGSYGGKLHLWTTSGGSNGEADSGGYRRLTIDSSGNVGIGTVTPAAKLEITGSSNSALLNIKSPISGAILYVSGSGAVGIGTSNVGAFTLQVSGSFGATTKSFIIDHPTKAGKKLMYGSLESPYHGIRLTGRDTLVNGKCKVELPDYMYKLILHDSINIQLTGIKCNKTLYVDDINIPENYFTIAYDKAIFESYKDYDFFWDFTAIRADVPELTTEL